MFRLKIKTDNDAFREGHTANEIARILEDVTRLVCEGYTSGSCRDVNGNRVGDWSLS